MSRRHSEAGFTLVELLFALVAASMLLIGLSWAIQGLARQLRRAETIGPEAQLIAIQPFLARTVGHALPPMQGAVLSGTHDHLWITIPAPAALGAAGQVRLALAVVGAPGAAALIARVLPDNPQQDLPAPTTAPRILASGFRSISIDYLRRAGDAPSRLPRLITFLFTTRDGKTLPLAFIPRLGLGADCVFDPISLTCRH